MRVLIKAELPVETGNATIKSGKLPHIIESILGELILPRKSGHETYAARIRRVTKV